MSQRVIVSFAVNDPDNGLPLGKASACSIGDDLELVNTLIGGGDVKVCFKGELLQVGRLRVPFLWSKDWYGNWCWDGYAMPAESALAIANYLMGLKYWRCEGGECNAFEKFNAKQKLTLEELLKAAA